MKLSDYTVSGSMKRRKIFPEVQSYQTINAPVHP
jgi:hypothetical protein